MEDKKGNVTLSKVTAVLCALVMLFSIIAFFGGDLTKDIDQLNEQIKYQKTLITQQEDRISQLESDLANYRQEKQQKEDSLAAMETERQKAIKNVEEKEKALQTAEKELDKVCSRSYYSSWSCSSACRTLHTAVSTRESELGTAELALEVYTAIENEIANLANSISQAEEEIQAAQNNLRDLKATVKKLNGQLTGAWFIVLFHLLAMVLALGGLGLFIKNFYTNTQDNFTLYAVAGLAGSSLLFLIAGAINNPFAERASLAYLLLNPHTWNLAVMGLFAAILRNATYKPVMLRNIAIVLSVILGVLTIVLGEPLIGALYAAAMICAAFVIVPLVFTEYIDIAKHIFLSLITFGIWQLVWTYHVTKNLNNVESVEKRRPARELLLCMFLPFYYPFWLYKTAEGVEDYGKEKEKEFKIDILCIAFSFVCPLFATVLIQNKLNVIAGKPDFVPVEAPEIVPEAEETEAVCNEV